MKNIASFSHLWGNLTGKMYSRIGIPPSFQTAIAVLLYGTKVNCFLTVLYEGGSYPTIPTLPYSVCCTFFISLSYFIILDQHPPTRMQNHVGAAIQTGGVKQRQHGQENRIGRNPHRNPQIDRIPEHHAVGDDGALGPASRTRGV